jgi:signal transduction histidine kinase/ActR/RegA family two-component response regulator
MSETRAAAQLRQQIALGKFGEIALTSDNLDHILTEACRLVADAVGTELAKVMELQKAGKILLVRAGVGWKKGIVGKLRIKATDNTSEGHALRTGNPMISPDIALETRFTYPPFLTDNGVQAVANVVIIGGLNRPPFGILQVDSREPRNFSEEDIVFLQSYANLVAAAVDRFRVESARLTTEKTARLAGEKAGILRAEHDSAIAANLSKSRFLAAASHDLRQPLHALGLFLHVLKSGLSPAQTKVADQMTIAVASMQRMFNGLLDVVRLDAGMMASRPQTFPLQSMFDTLQTSFAASAEAKGLVLELHPTSLSVTIDPVMLESILQNLMSNAISYTVYGKVTVAAHENADGIAVEVHDTGRGIPQDRLVDIFEEFVRLDRGGASENGIGLGLAIVHRQATELGATIDVRSTVGVGSTFTLNLPIVERISEQPTTQQQQQQQLSSLVGKRILLVEDNKPILSAMVMQAENWGARPLPAASADEAMSLLTLMMPESPDAAVVDLDLGDKVTGIELLTQIEEKFGIAIPAVIVTGSTTAGTMERINASGHPWLAKPTDPGALYEALVRRIASVVGRGALSQRPRS